MRSNTKLRRQYRAIVSYTGLIFVSIGLIQLTPLAVLLAWPEEAVHAPAFLVPGLLLAVAGYATYRVCRVERPVLNIQEGGVVVLLSWLGAFFVGSIPIRLTGDVGWTQALFESVSGWTTTGLSVVDVVAAPKMLLLWRSTMQVVGGAGFAIMMLAAITGPVGAGLSSAEGREEQLAPNVRQSAKLVVSIYWAYIVFGILAYVAAGMSVFDAVNHAFTAVSTAGFSTHRDSIGHFDSVAIEAVTVALMLAGSMSFLTVYLVLRRRYDAAKHSGELRVLAIAIALAAPLVCGLLTWRLYATGGKAVRVAIFETISAITTTGFQTVSYGDWSAFGVAVLVLLMIIGGGTCSTGGAVKQYRVYLLMKALGWEVRRALLPRSAVVEEYVWRGDEKQYVDDHQVRRVAVYVVLYLISLAVGTAVLAAHGHSIGDSLFEFASAQGNVGLSVGLTGPDTPALILWAQILGMFLGRLEFFVIIISVAKIVRDVPALVRHAPKRPPLRVEGKGALESGKRAAEQDAAAAPAAEPQ
ncbi:MAG: TrkH family potassium uptake protein [Planctomycetales bacterium]